MENLKVVVNQEVGTISLNFGEIKEKLLAEMDSYKNMTFTEESKKDAKATIADLRKLRAAVDTKRKEVKKEFIKPYEEFEKKVKELISIIDEPIELIDTKLKEFEEKRVQEKKALIDSIYLDTIGGFAGEIPLSAIYKKEWENAGTTKKAIEADMMAVFDNVKAGLDMIASFHSDCEENAVHMFLNNGFQITPVVTYINQYEQQKKDILERQRAEEERKAKEEEEVKVEEVSVIEKEEAQPIASGAEESSDMEEMVIPDAPKEVLYKITADVYDVMKLEKFLASNNIPFEREGA